MKLRKLLNLNNTQIVNYLNNCLPKNTITDKKNYWYLPGDTHTVLVAHVDTVRTHNKILLEQNKDKIRNVLGILGADDRAGVYACYKLHKETNCAVLFTNYEETGGKGVKKFTYDYPKFFSNTRLFIELDRQGNNEFVNYTYLPEEIENIIKEVTIFKPDFGTYSDIYELSTFYRIPAINVSIGFYNEHTKQEYLCLTSLQNSIENVKNLLQYEIPYYPDYDPYKNQFKYDYIYYNNENDFTFFNSSVDDVIEKYAREFFLTQYEMEELKKMLINSVEFKNIVEHFIINFFLKY